MQGGIEMAAPPTFANSLRRLVLPYLKAARLIHNYHFPSNLPAMPQVALEIKLKDQQGNLLKDERGAEVVIFIPDEKANAWVRHREGLLARWVGDDTPVASPMTESIAAPGGQVPEVSYWNMTQAGQLTLEKRPQHLVPRDRPIMGPSPISLLLVQSYARHACRTHGAVKADVFRRHWEPIPPMALLSGADVPPEAFDPTTSHFGEFKE
jgi:hypothetical protein